MTAFPDTALSLELPDFILAGLLKGELARQGGVVIGTSGNPHDGQIVTWLREAGTKPIVPDAIPSLLEPTATALAFLSPVASLLPLGPSVAFGGTAYKKLTPVEPLLEEMSDRIDQLGWIPEVSFVAALNSLAELAWLMEASIKAKLHSAAKLAWEAQQFDPASQQRAQQLNQALASATEALELVMDRTQVEMSGATSWLKAHSPWERLSVHPRLIETLQHFRQTCLAAGLRAAIDAELSRNLQVTAKRLDTDHVDLHSPLLHLAKAFLHGKAAESTDESAIYVEILSSAAAEMLPAQRIDLWAHRFDPAVGGLPGIIEMWRKRSHRLVKEFEQAAAESEKNWAAKMNKNAWGKALLQVTMPAIPFELQNQQRKLCDWGMKLIAPPDPPRDILERLSMFADLLDGAYEDVDRLSGHVVEYRAAGAQGLSMQQYRDALAVRDIPDAGGLVFFLRKSAM